MLLEPFELVRQEGVLYEQLRISQILNDGNGLDLTFGERHAANILVLVFDSLFQSGALRCTEPVVNFARGRILFFQLIVDFLVDLYDVLVDLPCVLRVDLLVRTVQDVSVARQAQVLQREVTLLVNVSVVILRYFGPDVLVFRWRLILRLVSFIFILNVDLALQPSSNIRRDYQASRPVLVVASGRLPYHVEGVGAGEWLGGSARKIQRLLDSILTDI